MARGVGTSIVWTPEPGMSNSIVSGPGEGVGVIDRLAERPVAAVVGVGHGERIRPGGEGAEEESEGREDPAGSAGVLLRLGHDDLLLS